MALTLKNKNLLEQQREYLFGTLILAQEDLGSLIKLSSTSPDSVFENVLKEGKAAIVSSYADLLVTETGEFYNRVREDVMNSSLYLRLQEENKAE